MSIRCLDADKDICPPNDDSCIWSIHHCSNCNKNIKISRRALTGKYMIADHRKECGAQ